MDLQSDDSHYQSGIKALTVLEKQYTVTNNTTLGQCLAKLYTLKYDGSMEAFLGIFRNISMEIIKTHNTPLTDRVLLTAILIALPDEFDSFKQKWNSIKDVNLAFAITELEGSEQFKTSKNHPIVNIKQEPQVHKVHANQKKWCACCRKDNHNTEDCWILKRETKNGTPKDHSNFTTRRPTLLDPQWMQCIQCKQTQSLKMSTCKIK